MSQQVSQVVGGQMVVSGATVVNAVGQQIVTQLVPGTTVHGSVIHSNSGTNVLTNSLPAVVAPVNTVNTGSIPPSTPSKTAVTQPIPHSTAGIKIPTVPATPPVLNKHRIADLVREVDPNEQLDEDVEAMLLCIADDFIESTVNNSCRLAKHRGSRTLDTRDVQLYLERNWHMWVPGFGTEELRPYKRAPTTEAHKQRLALIRKYIKKY